ncbi:hypothetical protein TW65_06104 [Stemphylium lycopersici]|nr:hypothetical protein TW65_06104 [Stemphylium lycopersici]
MARKQPDYEAEYVILRGTLLPIADYMVAWLEGARLRANHRRQAQGLNEVLGDDDVQQADAWPLPQILDEQTPLELAVVEPRFLRPWLALALFGAFMFALGFGTRCLL